VPVFTRCISLLLLLLFVRVLVPDTLILALHQHTHTVEKRLDTRWGDKQIATKHIHCPTDHLFHNTFYTLPAAVVLLLMPEHRSSYKPSFQAVWKFTFPNNRLSRGPPFVFSSLA